MAEGSPGRNPAIVSSWMYVPRGSLIDGGNYGRFKGVVIDLCCSGYLEQLHGIISFMNLDGVCGTTAFHAVTRDRQWTR